MGSDGRINGHTLQGAGCQKRRQAHFQRRALHQNPGMAFKQDINCGEIQRRFLPTDGDAINQITDAADIVRIHNGMVKAIEELNQRLEAIEAKVK